MIKQFLKIGGAKSIEDFYKKYATEEDFFNAHPEARQMGDGGKKKKDAPKVDVYRPEVTLNPKDSTYLAKQMASPMYDPTKYDYRTVEHNVGKGNAYTDVYKKTLRTGVETQLQPYAWDPGAQKQFMFNRDVQAGQTPQYPPTFWPTPEQQAMIKASQQSTAGTKQNGGAPSVLTDKGKATAYSNFVKTPEWIQNYQEYSYPAGTKAYGGPAGEHLAALPSFMQIGGPTNAPDPNTVLNTFTKGKTKYVKGASTPGWYSEVNPNSHVVAPIQKTSIPQGQQMTGYITKMGDSTLYNVPNGTGYVPSTEEEYTRKGFNPSNTSPFTNQLASNTPINQQQVQQLSGQPLKIQKEGGQHQQFEDTSFIDNKKNDFLKWLRETSFTKVQDDLQSEHNDFVMNHQMGGGLGAGDPSQGTRPEHVERPFAAYGGCMECGGMMNFGGGIPYQQMGGDISVSDLHPGNEMVMKHGGKKHSVNLRSYCQGQVTRECMTSALNSPDKKIRAAAAFHQSMMRSTMQMGGATEEDLNRIYAQQAGQSQFYSNPGQNPVITNTPPGYNMQMGIQPVQNQGMNWVNQPQGMGQRGTNLLQPNMETLPMITNQDLATRNIQQTQATQEKQMDKTFRQNTQQFQQRNRMSGEEKALAEITGIEKLTHMLNAKDTRNKEKQLKVQTHADKAFTPVTANMTSRGDYSVNEGYFRPDQQQPSQFAKKGGQYKANQDYYLSDKEIENLRAQGYQIAEY